MHFKNVLAVVVGFFWLVGWFFLAGLIDVYGIKCQFLVRSLLRSENG